jgi:predicted TIM-barrel fold metal-dependent hydrolase
MGLNDMVIISVDDHIVEPGNLFDKHLSAADLADAPKLKRTARGTNFWEYQGRQIPMTGLNAVAGRVPEEYGMEPTSLEHVRKGCYDVDARIGDMNVNGIAASLNFASCVAFDGSVFLRAPDRARALVHMRAYNDWHYDEWCGAHPGRFIPCGILPYWDVAAATTELKRLAKKGFTAVCLNDNPTIHGLPSIHNSHWDPLYAALSDVDVTIALHIGFGNPAPHASMETPIEAWITTMPMAISVSAADWLNLSALERHPNLRIALSEGGIGWVPYFLERADFTHEQHKAWTHSGFKNKPPSEVFREHFLTCFIDDAHGLKHLEDVGEDIVAYECDYPHSDSVWPRAPEILWERAKHLSPGKIDKITHANAMRFFRFDPFKHHQREALTVGALRAQAKQDGVDITRHSTGGASPLAPGETPRRVTSGDIKAMMDRNAANERSVGGVR